MQAATRSQVHVKRLALAITLILTCAHGATAQQEVGLPLMPPSGWLLTDTKSLSIPNTTVLYAWRDPSAQPGQFAQNINVAYQAFAGTLQAFGDASLEQIHSGYPGATIEKSGSTTVCGVPAYRFAWSGPVIPTILLHFDQVAVKTEHGVEFATYTRENAKAASAAALAALETFCHPKEPAA